MAELIDTYRKAAQRNAARAVGEQADQRRESVSQLKSARHESDILALPVDVSEWQPLQDLDPTSPTFGLRYFIPGLDIPGDPNHPIYTAPPSSSDLMTQGLGTDTLITQGF